MKDDENESRFLAVVARGSYLGHNRMDMQHAAKEISRFTLKPEEQDWRAAKLLARYLKDHRRIVLVYKYQELPKKMVTWSDTDFARCGRTRMSTSGFGSHCLKTYSQTQDTIALSSGESEFYGIVKAATMGLGMKSLFGDLGLEIGVQVNTDTSVARYCIKERCRASSTR